MNVKVSIIVPIYNVEKYLDRCMDSLLHQTLNDIEIIMVDDGSPDNCPQMCDEYAKKDSRIKVIHKQNAGLGFARNSGLEIATGEYVAFVDSDDHVSLTMYEDLYDIAKENKSDAVFGGIYMEGENGIWKQLHEFENGKTIKDAEINCFLLDMVACEPEEKKERICEMSVWRAIYKRSIIESCNIKFLSEREIVSEDIPFNVDFLKHAKVVSFIDKGFYYYHQNETSLTKNIKAEKFEGYKKLRSTLINKLGELDLNRKRSNRFFIGYCRMFFLQLASSNRNDKIDIINMIVNDDIWKEIEVQYDANSFSLYPKIIYCLTLRRKINLLYVASLIFMLLKKATGRRL